MEDQSKNSPESSIEANEASTEFNEKEYLLNNKRVAEEYLENPGFAKVFEVAVSDGSLTQEEVELWSQATGTEKYARLVAMTSKINPRKTSSGATLERSQINEGKSLSDQLNEATYELGESMDLDKPVNLPPGHYKALVVHGGIKQTPLLRVKFGLDSITPTTTWDKLKNIHDLPQKEYDGLMETVNNSNDSGEEFTRSAEMVVLCGCARPLEPGDPSKGVRSEAEIVENYAPDAKIETDLMNSAAEDWLKNHGLNDIAGDFQEIKGVSQAGRLSGSPYAIRIYDLTPAKQDGRLSANYPNAILSLNAPYDPTQKNVKPTAKSWNKRAGTADILNMLMEVVDFEPGDKVGSISHRPVSQAQRLATLNKMMSRGVEVEEAAYSSKQLFETIRWSEICKIASEASKVYAQADQMLKFFPEDTSDTVEHERDESLVATHSKLSSLGKKAMSMIRKLRDRGSSES